MKTSSGSTSKFVRHIIKNDYADAKKALEAVVETKIRERVQKSLRSNAK